MLTILCLPRFSVRSLKYGVQLESVTYAGRTPDFAYMLLFLAAALLASTAALGAAILSTSLISAVIYVWSRANQTTNVSFFGLFSVAGFYLPFTLLAWTIVQGGDPIPDIRGIVAGHCYYFLATVWPRAGGPNLLTTPELVKQAVHWAFGCVALRRVRVWQRERVCVCSEECADDGLCVRACVCARRGFGYVNPNYVRPAAQAAAFQGRGRRLND